MHALRQTLEPDPTHPQVILREGEGYCFAPQIPYFLDVERFEELLHHGDTLDGLAALEVLVHADSYAELPEYQAFPVEFDSALVSDLPELPPDWQQSPAPLSTKSLGSQ